MLSRYSASIARVDSANFLTLRQVFQEPPSPYPLPPSLVVSLRLSAPRLICSTPPEAGRFSGRIFRFPIFPDKVLTAAGSLCPWYCLLGCPETVCLNASSSSRHNTTPDHLPADLIHLLIYLIV